MKNKPWDTKKRLFSPCVIQYMKPNCYKIYGT